MIRIIIIVFIIACAGPFFIKDKKGRPFLSVEKIKRLSYVKFVELKHLLKLDTIPEAETETIAQKEYNPYKDQEFTEMYKYRDEKGVLHFTDTKPKHQNHDVMYMPKSKEPGVIEKTVTEMMDTVFNGNKPEQKSSLKKLTEIQTSGKTKEGKSLSPGDILSQTKEILKNATGQYKEAPNALNDAKELKNQVEDVYQEREKMMDGK